jgi:hypothetical protein
VPGSKPAPTAFATSAITGRAGGCTSSATAVTTSPSPRRYSVTFGRLRQARRDWHLTRRPATRARDAERRITTLAHTEPVEHVQGDDHTDSATDQERFALVVQWRLDGIGWRTVGDALLAQTARTQALNARAEARAQRAAERALEPWID